MKAFSPLLKLKNGEELVQGEDQQKDFEQIKQTLVNLPVPVPPMPSKTLRLYILMSKESISYLLAQDVNDGTERAIYYLR